MKGILFVLFGSISAVLGAVFLVRALRVFKYGKRAERILSSIQVFTIGVFLSTVLVFIPIYYTSYNFGDPYGIVRPFLIAVHNSFRVFILDGEFDIIVCAVKQQHILIRLCFTGYAACLYVIAPILTFSNVLSLFKNIQGELRYRWHRRKNFYIMSELNKQSVALARSILKNRSDAMIVFADVFEQNGEDNYELLTKARDMHAICLKKDVTSLDIQSKEGDVEIFLIGNDESENVSQAVKITTKLDEVNAKQNVKVFVFSGKPSAGYIIDSIRYDNLLDKGSENQFKEGFKLRRINKKQQLIWNTVPQMNLYNLADRNDKTLSVMIVGFGSYGMELFKMLLWYCQFEDYKIKISIFDKRENYIEPLIRRNCPELLKEENGQKLYDIQIFSGVDALTAELDDLLLTQSTDPEKAGVAQRLQGTNLAFVSLGDDDVNIEMAIHLRGLFDRVRGLIAKDGIAWEEETADIYTVVYDDHKSEVLYNPNIAGKKANILRNQKETAYHIHFIGGMSEQYDYENIYDPILERCAFKHHVDWVVNATQKKEESKKYEQYEYYRLSSVAKELYQREIQRSDDLKTLTTCLLDPMNKKCECENCIRRKKSEHYRWNAFTRGLGYVYKDGMRADRALVHNNLCPWEDLSEEDKLKD